MIWCVFIHQRPEYYKIYTHKEMEPIYVVCAKHRNGAVGDVRLRLSFWYTRFPESED